MSENDRSNIAANAIAWRDEMNHPEIVKAMSSLIAEEMAVHLRNMWQDIKARDAMSHDDFWASAVLATAMCLKVMQGVSATDSAPSDPTGETK